MLVLTDLERKIVLDVLPDRKKESLIQWLKMPPAGVDLSELAFVATDLWSHYRAGAHAVFPHVAVVADRFHVMQNLHQVIHKVRRTAQQSAETDAESKQLKGLRFLLLKNEQNLTQPEKQRLQQLASSHPQLYQLCQLRQQFHEWYEVHTIPEFARITLFRLCEQARQLGLKALNSFCHTIIAWEDEVVNFFAHRITSGFVEGMNSKIRVLKRIAFGLPNPHHFRLRILAFCG